MTPLPHDGDRGAHTVDVYRSAAGGWVIECDECGWGKGPFTSEADATAWLDRSNDGATS